jgi:hypothetical protein
MHVSVSRGKEIPKPVAVSNYNPHMGKDDLRGQMFQPYLLELKKGSK